MIKILHNPRCRKSRETLGLLDGESVEIIEYLKNPPTAQELRLIIEKLGMSPLEVIRKNEQIFKEKFRAQNLSDDEWIQIMVDHPILIERPIVITEDSAIIGRPPERVREIL